MDLLQQIGAKGAELELSSHSLSYTMADGEVLQTRALKVVTTAEYSEWVLESLITALTGDVSDEWANSTTAEFKLIPFQNTAISRNGMAELIEHQNTFIHGTIANSVVNMGTGDENFSTETDGKEYVDGNIRDWAMEKKTEEDTYLFQSVEPGRRGQCYFLHQKNRQEEAEK